MSPFSIAIIIGIILIGISIAMGGFVVFNPLFIIGIFVLLAGIIAKIKKWWAKGYQ